MGAIYSVLISRAGPLSSKSCAVTGVDGKPHTHYFTGSFTCQFEQWLISHAFLVVPEFPTPLLGRDFLSSLGAILWLGDPEQPLILTLTKTDQPEEQGPIPSHILQTVDPSVWDKGITWRAINAQPVRISLRSEAAYPNKRQYLIKLGAKKGLQPIADKFLKHGLLVRCQSPWNTSILPVVKPNGEYGMVQDLRAVNVAVVTIHPLVANPYNIRPNPWGHQMVYCAQPQGCLFFFIPVHSSSQLSVCLPVD